MILQFTLLAISTAGFVTATTLLKSFADGHGYPYLGFSFLILIASNLVYAQLLKDSMGNAVLMSSITYQVAALLLAVTLYGERFTAFHAGALILSGTALWLATHAAQAAAVAR